MALLAALLAAAAALTFTGYRFTLARARPPAHASLPPPGLLPGRLRDRGPARLPADRRLRPGGGRQPNLAGYYSGWAEPFSASFAQTLHGHGVIPCVQIDPTYASVSAIAAGAYDGYLQGYADSIREFGHAVVIGLGREMNGYWYPWGLGYVQPRRSWWRGGTS